MKSENFVLLPKYICCSLQSLAAIALKFVTAECSSIHDEATLSVQNFVYNTSRLVSKNFTFFFFDKIIYKVIEKFTTFSEWSFPRLRQTSQLHYQASFVRKIIHICNLRSWV